MKKILCYGDSNTFGYVPEDGSRYPKNIRWTGILGEYLEKDFEIIEQGMNNRTGFFKSLDGLKQSGTKYLPIVLEQYQNIDSCILSLGTNDLQFFYNLDEEITENGLTSLIKILKNANQEIKIIIIPPVKIKENIINGRFSFQFDLTSVEKVHQVFHIFKKVAEKENCYYLDLNEFVTPSKIDGLHFSKSSHKLIAEKLAELIKEIFKN